MKNNFICTIILITLSSLSCKEQNETKFDISVNNYSNKDGVNKQNLVVNKFYQYYKVNITNHELDSIYIYASSDSLLYSPSSVSMFYCDLGRGSFSIRDNYLNTIKYLILKGDKKEFYFTNLKDKKANFLVFRFKYYIDNDNSEVAKEKELIYSIENNKIIEKVDSIECS